MKKIILMLALVMPMTVFAQKFGHCNQQEILSAMPELAKVRGEIELQCKTNSRRRLKSMKRPKQP